MSFLSFRNVVVASLALSTVAFGQVTVDHYYQIRYASNLNLGDSVINATNTGAAGAGLAAGTSGSTTGALCLNAYVFSPDEQMVACCSCPVTPNGLVKLSVLDDLVYRTLTPAVPTAVVVKLLSTVPGSGGACNAATAAVNTTTGAFDANLLRPGLLAWGTTLHAGPAAGAVTMTETPFLPATLSTVGGGTGSPNIGEHARLTQLCGFIQANGSTYGICKSCTIGGLGAGRL